MKTRKLANIDVFEISFCFFPNKPAVPGARPLIIKGALPYLETEEAKSILRQCAAIVDKLKLEAKEREQAAARTVARPQRVRTRVYDTYEAYENSAAQVRRKNARATFIAECAELAHLNRNKQSDFGK